jgi:hypothetical protein
MKFKKLLPLAILATLILPLSAIATTTKAPTPSDQPLTPCDSVSIKAPQDLDTCVNQLKSKPQYKNQTDSELQSTCQNFPTIAHIYNERTKICGPNPYDNKNTANTSN